MIIDIMTNNSEKNAVTKNTTNIATLNGVLKNGTSLINPVVTVHGIDNNSITACNYARIHEFGRYYFIENVTSVNNGLWEISLHVDVLSTYKTQILQQTAVIKRQEKNWNLYLDDDIFKTYQNPKIVTKLFPYGFTTQNYILAVAGG